MWRTPDTPDNAAAFAKPGTPAWGDRLSAGTYALSHGGPAPLGQAVMESCAVNEMVLAEQLIARRHTHSLTLFRQGVLFAWPAPRLAQTTGCERHWLLPLKKGTQYEVVRKLGRQDVLVHLKTSPQARKKWPQLPDTVEARLLTLTSTARSAKC